jgi:hypothetical protein
MIAGMETTSTTGTKQIQGYIEFGDKVRRPKAEWMFGGRGFLVPAGGGREANERDCKKTGNMLFKKKDGKEDAAMKRSRDPEEKNQGKWRGRLEDSKTLTVEQFQ